MGRNENDIAAGATPQVKTPAGAPTASRRNPAHRLRIAALACAAVVLTIAAICVVAVFVGAMQAVWVAGGFLLLLAALRPFTTLAGVLRARGKVIDTAILLALAAGLILLSPVAQTMDIAGF